MAPTQAQILTADRHESSETMADQDAKEKKDGAAAAEGDAAEPKKGKAKKGTWRGRLRQPLWICLIIGTTIVAHGLMIAVHALVGTTADRAGGEVNLGEFAYVNSGDKIDSILRAGFQVHIRLLDGVEKSARRRLSDRQFRVKQDIEQLLRRAHGTDFADPALSELKRQLQETVNQSLELRAIDEVIVTGLDIEKRDPGTPGPDGDQAAVTSIDAPAQPAG
jgi:flagellar basal body-associated protein FliL